MRSDMNSIIGTFPFLVLCTVATSGWYPHLSYGIFRIEFLGAARPSKSGSRTSTTLLGRLSSPRASDRYMLLFISHHASVTRQRSVISLSHPNVSQAGDTLLRPFSTVFDSVSSPLTMSKPSSPVISTTHHFQFQLFQSGRTSAHA